MPGIAGPPTVPPLPPLTTDDTRPRTSKRPGFDARDRWSWLAAALYGPTVFEVITLRHLSYLPVLRTGLAAGVTAAVLWRWLMPAPPTTTAASRCCFPWTRC